MHGINFSGSDGYAGYYDSGRALGAIAGAMSGLDYNPSLADVGHGSAYWPGDTTADAAALNYLGFLPDPYLRAHVGTTGNQAGDMRSNVGAWDPAFKTAVQDFQETASLAADGWIGPATRKALAAAVAAKNANGGLPAPIGPGGAPAAAPAPSSTGKKLALGAAVLAAGYAVYHFFIK